MATLVRIQPWGPNFRNVQRHIKRLELSTKHFSGKAHGTTVPKNKKSLEEICVRNSAYTATHRLKSRLLKTGYIKNICGICQQASQWNGQKLTMVLDHINGVNNDHRLSNLRMLCPNCNSQQPTFCKGK